MTLTTFVRIDRQPVTPKPADEPVPQYAAPIGEHDRPLIEAVRTALRKTGYLPLRDVLIEANAGVVVLWGQVPTYHQKQLAQAVIQAIQGVRGVSNGLEVACQRSRNRE